jgi:hypothetical protein
MKKEPGGYRVIDTPQLRRCMQSLVIKNTPFSSQRSLHTSKITKEKDWDTVSLESSDSGFGEGSSAESKLFPFLFDEKDSLIKVADKALKKPLQKPLLKVDISISTDMDRYTSI